MIKNNFKEKHRNPISIWRKQVLQNQAVAFRPVNNVLKMLNEQINRSQLINNALLFWKFYKGDLQDFLMMLKKRHPLDWKYVNRKRK